MEIKYQYYKWLDIITVTKNAIVNFAKDFIVFVCTYDENKDLPSVTNQPCQCDCGWSGIVWDCELDEDTGDLLCPNCLEVIEVVTWK